jgi:hypothetical protein
MRILYRYYISPSEKNVTDRVQQLLNQIKDMENIISLSFLGYSSDSEYYQDEQLIKDEVIKIFRSSLPLVTYIIQPLADKQQLAVEVMTTDASCDRLEYEGIHYAYFQDEKEKFLLTEGLVFENDYFDENSNCSVAFSKMQHLLQKHSMQLNDIVRQWNYIGNITQEYQGRQIYQLFNDSRTRFYQQGNWEKGYPSATGIGMDCSKTIISLLCYTGACYPIDNPLQQPAHRYSSQVLLGKEADEKSTPKFERAKAIKAGIDYLCFISGTAAIRGEASMLDQHADSQVIQTLENISHLISADNLKRSGLRETCSQLQNLRIYIKKKEHYPLIENQIKQLYPHVPTLFVLADICRDELLVEIEGTATIYPS